jgi:hypothetical protein
VHGGSGAWVGKFESSDGGSNGAMVIPNVTSWRGLDAKEIYGKGLTFAKNNGLSGYTSRIMRNSDWGAVTYLAYSKYGRNGTEVTINNSSECFTGRAGATISDDSSSSGTYTYETSEGQLASTTGNIYGVYDMSGGTTELVMTFVNTDTIPFGFSELSGRSEAEVCESGSDEVGGASGDLVGTQVSGVSWFGDAYSRDNVWGRMLARGRECNPGIDCWFVPIHRMRNEKCPGFCVETRLGALISGMLGIPNLFSIVLCRYRTVEMMDEAKYIEV